MYFHKAFDPTLHIGLLESMWPFLSAWLCAKSTSWAASSSRGVVHATKLGWIFRINHYDLRMKNMDIENIMMLHVNVRWTTTILIYRSQRLAILLDGWPTDDPMTVRHWWNDQAKKCMNFKLYDVLQYQSIPHILSSNTKSTSTRWCSVLEFAFKSLGCGWTQKLKWMNG